MISMSCSRVFKAKKEKNNLTKEKMNFKEKYDKGKKKAQEKK